MKATKTVPFEIYLPRTEDRPAQHVETIDVEVYEEFGEEILTPESSDRIEAVRVRHMGLLHGEDIKALRSSFELTQKDFADLIQCGKKSLSRWENGHGYPSGLVNTLLRLLELGRVNSDDLLAVRGPRPVADTLSDELRKKIVQFHFDADNAALLDADIDCETQAVIVAS